MREFLKDNTNPQPTVGKACEETMKAVGDHHEAFEENPDKKEEALECLTLIILSYLAATAKPVEDADSGEMRQPTIDEVKSVQVRT